MGKRDVKMMGMTMRVLIKKTSMLGLIIRYVWKKLNFINIKQLNLYNKLPKKKKNYRYIDIGWVRWQYRKL